MRSAGEPFLPPWVGLRRVVLGKDEVGGSQVGAQRSGRVSTLGPRPPGRPPRKCFVSGLFWQDQFSGSRLARVCLSNQPCGVGTSLLAPLMHQVLNPAHRELPRRFIRAEFRPLLCGVRSQAGRAGWPVPGTGSSRAGGWAGKELEAQWVELGTGEAAVERRY